MPEQEPKEADDSEAGPGAPVDQESREGDGRDAVEQGGHALHGEVPSDEYVREVSEP